MTFRVTFLPIGKSVDVDGGSIADVAKKANVQLSLFCGGNGRCGRCVVFVKGERLLACRTEVTGDITVTVPKEESGKIIASSDFRDSVDSDFIPDDGKGLAVDIGTTTVAVNIVDLKTGITVLSSSGVNYQRTKGEDVIARIQASVDGETANLRKSVIKSINGLIPEDCQINKAYVSGNTVMTYLFLGKEPEHLRYPPFKPKLDVLEISGLESKLKISKDAQVDLMPCAFSYVGGDITSGIVYSGLDKSKDMSLFIDVGTNGEVALGNSEMLLVCSSSAGPAFEGSGLTSGMIASEGAIDSVSIKEGKLVFTTIGGVKAKGICGSGIIDLIACLLKLGYIDRHGKFTDAECASRQIFTLIEDVVIKQDEIESIILTKAAVYSAARTLVRSLGITFDDVKKIYIAGGFGNYINSENAISIGMFPDVSREKYIYLGNASLAGAKHALISKSFRERIQKVYGMMTYIDLGSEHIFYDEYMSAQFLPHTDKTQFKSQRY